MEKDLQLESPYLSPLAPHEESLGNRNPFEAGISEQKKAKIFSSLAQAFDDFDKIDDESVSQYILPVGAVPPVPTPVELEHHLLQNALLLIDGGDFPLARHVLGQILRRNSHAPDAIRWMGWCFRQEGDLENARKCYEQLVKIRVNEEDLFDLGEIQYSLKLDDEALATWTDALGQCLEESPRLFDLYKNIGNGYLRQGDYDGAEENYNKALTLRPQSDVLQVNLGSLFFQRQQFIRALQHFKSAVESNAYNDRAWCGVALVAREMKDLDWAKASLLKALDINPFNLVALQILVSWAQADHDWTTAIERVQKYTFENQDDANMAYTLAGLYYQQGNKLSAELELTRLEALEPGRADSLELRQLVEGKI